MKESIKKLHWMAKLKLLQQTESVKNVKIKQKKQEQYQINTPNSVD